MILADRYIKGECAESARQGPSYGTMPARNCSTVYSATAHEKTLFDALATTTVAEESEHSFLFKLSDRSCRRS